MTLIPPEGFRGCTVKLWVAWDPETQDHPQSWGWENLLETEAHLLDFEDDRITT
jgi:hypothetical protein